MGPDSARMRRRLRRAPATARPATTHRRRAVSWRPTSRDGIDLRSKACLACEETPRNARANPIFPCPGRPPPAWWEARMSHRRLFVSVGIFAVASAGPAESAIPPDPSRLLEKTFRHPRLQIASLERPAGEVDPSRREILEREL